MDIEQLKLTPAFQLFLEERNVLDLFLALHQSKDLVFFDEKSFFNEPIVLNEFFPKARVQLRLVDLGVIEITPTVDNIEDFPLVFLYSAGLHGNETAPIEIINDLFSNILSGEQTVATAVMFQFGHFEAMLAHRRQIEENLNRCFDPLKSLHYNTRSQESIRAFRLQKTLHDWFASYSQAKLVHFDLHTAIRASLHKRFCVIPHKQDERALDFRLLQSLMQMQIEAALFSEGASSTYSYYTYQLYDAQSFTIELGSVKPFGKNDHVDFLEARLELTRLIESAQFAEESQELNLAFYDVVRVIKRTSEDFKLFFAEDIPNFTAFKERTPLAQDGERTYTSHHDEERVVFPNSKVGVGERACLIVRPELIKPTR
jgi:succinylglutamate desuccinylase